MGHQPILKNGLLTNQATIVFQKDVFIFGIGPIDILVGMTYPVSVNYIIYVNVPKKVTNLEFIVKLIQERECVKIKSGNASNLNAI